jgi:tRNA-Thr(GGU) m(6)t(6)A37 methyltransferase TsaA
MGEERPGELRAPVDPAGLTGDATLVFIGRAQTPWQDREACPKNMRVARERGLPAWLEIDPAWRLGLRDLRSGDGIVVITWLDRARRDLIVQVPSNSRPTGVFALRSPVRPNPIGLHNVRVVAIDHAAGRIEVEALDCLDGTPVLDIKPWLPTVDILPAAGPSDARAEADATEAPR